MYKGVPLTALHSKQPLMMAITIKLSIHYCVLHILGSHKNLLGICIIMIMAIMVKLRR